MFSRPKFGVPSHMEILLGVDTFTEVLLHGQRKGPPGSPIVLEMQFGWVLCGSTETSVPTITTCHASVGTDDDLLRRIKEPSNNFPSPLSIEERMVVQHFKTTHSLTTASTSVNCLLVFRKCSSVRNLRTACTLIHL